MKPFYCNQKINFLNIILSTNEQLHGSLNKSINKFAFIEYKR